MKSVIIDRLIKIEESAGKLSQDIKDKEAAMPALIQKECEEIERRYMTDYQKNSTAAKLNKEKECEDRLRELDKEYESRKAKLDELFSQNHNSWENDILNAVIGR